MVTQAAACTGAGWVGFDRDLGANRTLDAGDAGDAMDATADAMMEVELRNRDQLRPYRFWRQVCFKGLGVGFCSSLTQKPGRPGTH